MLVYCILFAVFAMGSEQIILNAYGIVTLQYSTIPWVAAILDWTIILCQLLQIPFKFYLGKEFVYILIDELLNRSISRKMDHLKYYQTMTSGKDGVTYSETVIQRVRDDLYQIVRMPYMKFSNKWYYTIGIAIYMFNLSIVMLLRLFYIGNSS